MPPIAYCLLPIALFPLAFLLSACSPSTPVAPTPGTPASLAPFEEAHVLDVATTICRHTQGSFPIWSLWENYADYLLPTERNAFDYVARRLAKQFGPSGLAQYLAVDRFIAQNTECILASEPKPGAKQFIFTQKSPFVPNIAPPVPSKGQSLESLVRDAVARMQDAYLGEMRAYEVTVRLVREEGEEPVYPTEVAHTIAVSLARSDFWEAMESARLDLAQQAFDTVCLFDEASCAKLRPWIESAWACQSRMAQGLAQDLVVTSRRMETIVPAGGSQHTVAEFSIENRGTRPYSDIVMVTDEKRAQYCTLEDEAGNAIRIEVGATVTARCFLRAETMPTVPIAFWIAQ